MKNPNILKEDYLINHGFRYDFNREIFYNKKSKKVFSIEAVKDHDKQWLELSLKDPNNDWEFYFNNDPSINIREQLIRYLNP